MLRWIHPWTHRSHLPHTGLTDHAALAAAILIPLLLLLLCVVCCCCGAGPADARDRYQCRYSPSLLNSLSPSPLHATSPRRAAVPDDDVVARMKHHVQGVLANISAMMPCFTLNSSKLPKVTGEKADLLPALFCARAAPLHGTQTSSTCCLLPSFPPRCRNPLQPQLHRVAVSRVGFRQLLLLLRH